MSFDIEPDGEPHGECAAEINRLREAIKEIQREAYRAGKHGCCLTEKAIHEWANAALGEPSLNDLVNKRTGQ